MLNGRETSALFINLKPPFAFERRGEGPLSAAGALYSQDNGDCRGEMPGGASFRHWLYKQGDGAAQAPGVKRC